MGELGLNVHVPSNAILEDVAQNLKMGWIRVDFDWFHLEPNKGEFNFIEHDRLVNRAEELGLNILGVLAYSPFWAAPALHIPPSERDWTEAVCRVVERYESRVNHWQLWNEPNISHFWGGTSELYRDRILIPGATAARSVNPAVKIVGPGLAHTDGWQGWFKPILQAKQYLDIINHHNYQNSGREVLEGLERTLRPLMRTLGVDDMPFWLTETGRRSSHGDQLKYYQDVVGVLNEKPWVEKLFFFHYWDGPGKGNGGEGIVNEDFSPKPAYRFLQGEASMPNFGPIISMAYKDILRREADPGGLAHYNDLMRDGLREVDLREGLIRSQEYADKNPDNPVPPPPPPPPPSGMELRVEGNKFVGSDGEEVKLLGAVQCCDAPDTSYDDAKIHWWPLIDRETLEKLASFGLNWTHIRLGPFTVEGEADPNYVGYLTLPDGRVDLDRWFIHFWGRARSAVAWARSLGIYVEVDLVDRWVRQHGASDMPKIDPWRSTNNIQGRAVGGLGIFENAPNDVHEKWIRKCVKELGEFPNVMFNTGNEGFKRFSLAWELGVRDIVKDELANQGYGDRLIGSNTHDVDIERGFDYATRHLREAQNPEAYPVMVTEYGTLRPEEVLREARDAREKGTSFHFWMGSQSTAERQRTLEGLQQLSLT
jgi:hypothetical protein